MGARKPLKDLREYLARLEEYGMLINIDREVHWNLESSAIATMNMRLGGPALHFTNIKGYPGHSLATCLFSAHDQRRPWEKVSVAFGLEPKTPMEEMRAEIRNRMAHPIKPVVVSSGPCKEVIKLGKECNVYDFPLPYIHDGDGGRMVGTCHSVITKDYDTDWVNWGMYRVMAHSKTKMGGSFQVGQHMANMYYMGYERNNVPMPFAIVLGDDPAVTLTACCFVPDGVSEVDVVGGLRRAPVELVKCETNDLLVPANSEIVIEGEVRPHERWDEGPFGEYDGYMNAPRLPRPVYRIHAITHRKNPVFPFIVEGIANSDGMTLASVMTPAAWEAAGQAAGLPVTRIVLPQECQYMWGSVATKIPYPGYAHDLSQFFFAAGMSAWLEKFVVYDAWADITNSEELFEEWVLKTHPKRDYHVTPEIVPLSQVASYKSTEEKMNAYGADSIMDASTSLMDDPPLKVSFESSYSEETQAWVLENWEEFGFEEEAEMPEGKSLEYLSEFIAKKREV